MECSSSAFGDKFTIVTQTAAAKTPPKSAGLHSNKNSHHTFHGYQPVPTETHQHPRHHISTEQSYYEPKMYQDVELPTTIKNTRRRANSWTSSNPLKTLGLIAIWYSFSTTSTLLNKILIKHYHVSAEILTFVHLIVGTSMDVLFFMVPTKSQFKMWSFHPVTRKGLLMILPLSILGVAAKVLTYWSYGKVPIAVAHTAKASTPLFNVMITWLVYSKKFSLSVYLSLLPIVVGVSMASISEVQVNDFAAAGVSFALTAALLSVFQSMYSKYLLIRGVINDSINLHFYNGLLSICISMPWIVLSGDTSLFNTGVSVSTLALCSLSQFVGSFVAYYMLSKVSELTYSILGTLKRVVLIATAVVYFGNPLTTTSFTGMMLAMGGIGTYQWAKVKYSAHNS